MELLFNSSYLLLPLNSVKLPLQQISTQYCQDAFYDFIDRNDVNLDTEAGNAA